MTPNEFQLLCARLFPVAPTGRKGRPATSVNHAADHLGVSRSTTLKWAQGEREIPIWASDALRLIDQIESGPPPRLQRAIKAMQGQATAHNAQRIAARDGDYVWVIDHGEPVGVGVWRNDRIESLRLYADRNEVALLAQAIRGAIVGSG